MAGLYIHIPFCASRCIYCDFFSTTRLQEVQEYTDAVCKELQERSLTSCELYGKKIDTIYFGGGTPSQLPLSCLIQIFENIYKYFEISDNAEITLECNPEDIDKQYLYGIDKTPVNRLSFGIQTFDDQRLLFLHRRHNSSKAIRCVEECQDSGYDNISIDLIYGFPSESMSSWEKDIVQALELKIQHISAYSLSYEEGTVLSKMLKSGKISATDEDKCSDMYYYLVEKVKSAGYDHYEISNFALSGYQSRHNSSYWSGIPYIGIGAGAHSYDGLSRRWNISSIDAYISGLNSGEKIYERERLSESDHYNEYVMTRLRTNQGINQNDICEKFSQSIISYYKKCLKRHSSEIEMIDNGNRIRIKEDKLFVSDDIISDLFIV